MTNLIGEINASQTLTGIVSTQQSLTGEINIGGTPPSLQEKTVSPSLTTQEVIADGGYGGLSKVVVEAIPNNYGLITYSGYELTVS